MRLPEEFNADADFNAEACDNCGICGQPDQPGRIMLYAGTMTMNLCRDHALAFARFIDRIAGPS